MGLSSKALFMVLMALFMAFAMEAVLVDASAQTRHYKFQIKMQKVKRLCEEKSIVTVNGKFPGPQITAREGDRLIITVVNHVPYNVTLHWHGVKQFRTGWADGPAYITQCPIQTGQSFVHNFTVTGQTGTLFWHAHISWLRVTLYGPIIILPKRGNPYPFPRPYKEIPIMLGEWLKEDTEMLIEHLLQSGGPIDQPSEAYTINGLPGPSYNCSTKDTFRMKLKPGKTYLLRLINAALNSDFFFGITNHTLTVVEVDAVYVKPFETDTIFISPGQTTNLLLRTKTHLHGEARFAMSAKPHPFAKLVRYSQTITTGILEYETQSPNLNRGGEENPSPPLLMPVLPDFTDSIFADSFGKKLRSLSHNKVPLKVDKHFFFTAGLGITPCPENQTCFGFNGQKMAAPINNVSFVQPETALLQAHYFNQSNGVYSSDFPETPLFKFDYTGFPPINATMVKRGTMVSVLRFNTVVEIVLQGTSIINLENHPFHLHGYNFFVVGRGSGNFDPERDPANFNLVDPVERNTVSMPTGGWVAIRFIANNPGVWLMHCHLEIHMSWGMEMAWVVLDGDHPDQKLLPPPSDLPKC